MHTVEIFRSTPNSKPEVKFTDSNGNSSYHAIEDFGCNENDTDIEILECAREWHFDSWGTDVEILHDEEVQS